MIVLKDCPNCGSFDIALTVIMAGWIEDGICSACGTTWREGHPPTEYDRGDGYDDDGQIDPLTDDDLRYSGAL